MRKINRVLALFCALALLLTVPAFGAGKWDSDFYVVNDTLVNYVGSATDVTIPAHLGIKVISSTAFKKARVRSVRIPEGVTKIDRGAFAQSTVSSITLPQSLETIENNAFKLTQLSSVIIPANVKEVGKQAFAGCNKLKTVVFQGGSPTIEPTAFYGCPIEYLYIPASVTDISPAMVSQELKGNITIYCEEGSYAQQFAQSYRFGCKTVKNYAVTATCKVTVNGKEVPVAAYNIDGNNYFRLRDLASALSGTAKQFDVAWSGDHNVMDITTGKAYTPVGGENAPLEPREPFTASRSGAYVAIDGAVTFIAAYNIDGNNYFRLRDLGRALNFGVTYDAATNTVAIDTATGYTE